MKTARVLTVLLFALSLGATARADVILTDTWYLAAFDALGGPVTGAGRDGVDSIDPGSPAWTFTIADDHVLTVLDCCVQYDQFDVYDGATFLGFTSGGITADFCSTAAACDVLPGVGRGDFLLGAGFHSITMTVSSFYGPGELFFSVRDVPDQVPEPGMMLLAAVGVAALGLRRRLTRG
jgi:MYXO-CTERM domain-containing protein